MSVSLLRTVLLYCAVIAAIRIMGKRQIGELDPAELVITILISDLAAIPMQDLGVPLFAGLVPIATLICMEIFTSCISMKSSRFYRLLNGQPAIIIQKGQLDRHKLRQMRITADEVVETLRKQNVTSIADVKYGVLEPDGSMTVVLESPHQPVTAEMLGVVPKDTGLPLVVVSNGKMVTRSLQLLHLAESDVLYQLQSRNLSLRDVFVMTLDDCGNTFIQTKGQQQNQQNQQNQQKEQSEQKEQKEGHA